MIYLRVTLYIAVFFFLLALLAFGAHAEAAELLTLSAKAAALGGIAGIVSCVSAKVLIELYLYVVKGKYDF